MGTHQHTYNFNERFDFSGKSKTWSLIAILIGVIAIVYGFVFNGGERTFANLLLMGYYFACVCLSGVFFLAIKYVSQAGWSAGMLRIPQAFASIVPIACLILLIICGVGLYSGNLYHHWAAPGLTDPDSPNFDALITEKSGYLNPAFFFVREILFMAVYSIFALVLTKLSYNEDLDGGITSYKKSFKLSAIFLVIFGFTSPVWSFDTVMSLEAHWFSTMFGWYNLAALWISGLCAITLTLILLNKAGYLSWINENHLHELAKFIFGFSIFWTYVWFAQFLLTWYANIPEEAVYFYKRFEPEYKPWFWLNIVINFVVPVLVLLNRPWARSKKVLGLICVILLMGHWLDYYIMVMPGTVGVHRGFGLVEIGTAIGFTGLFAFLMLNKLSKHALAPINHPFLEESLDHQI